MGSDKTTAWTRTLITCSTNQWHLFFSPPGPQELHWIHWETWHCGWNISSVWGCVQHPETTVRAPCLTNLLVEAEWGVCQIQGLCFQEPAPCQLWGWLLSSSVCAACTPRMVCWDCHCLGVLFYRCAGLFGRLCSVGSFPSGWVSEGSGIAVSLLSNFIPVSSCSWSPLERLILSLLLWSSGILAIN